MIARLGASPILRHPRRAGALVLGAVPLRLAARPMGPTYKGVCPGVGGVFGGAGLPGYPTSYAKMNFS